MCNAAPVPDSWLIKKKKAWSKPHTKLNNNNHLWLVSLHLKTSKYEQLGREEFSRRNIKENESSTYKTK